MPLSRSKRMAKRKKFVDNWLRRNADRPKWKDKAKPDKVAAAHRYADMMMKQVGGKKKSTRQSNPRKAGGYVTTRGQRKKQMDSAADYTLE